MGDSEASLGVEAQKQLSDGDLGVALSAQRPTLGSEWSSRAWEGARVVFEPLH